MKKSILFGTILSVFLILMIPSIPAIEYNNVVEENKSNFINKFVNLDFNDFIQRLKDFDKKEFLNNILDSIKNVIYKLNEKFFDYNDQPDEQPLFFPILGIIFYGLIAIIILGILFSIFNSIFNVIKLVLGLIIGSITGVIGSVWNVVVGAANIVIIILTFFVDLVIAIINGSLITLANIGQFILTLLVNLYNFITKIASQIWAKYVTVLGLILDIIKLIYDTIFKPGIMTG